MFTFPEQWRPYLTPALCLEVERRWRRGLQALYSAAHRTPMKVGIKAFWHPRGDACGECGHGTQGRESNSYRNGSCDGCGAAPQWAPHINYLVPLLGLTDEGALQPLRGKVPQSFLSDVRSMALSVLTDVGDFTGMMEQPTANVHYSFRLTEAKVVHSCTYMARPFPEYHDALSLLHQGRDYGVMATRSSDPATRWQESIRMDAEEDDGPEEEDEPTCNSCGTTLVFDAMYGALSEEYALLAMTTTIATLRQADRDRKKKPPD